MKKLIEWCIDRTLLKVESFQDYINFRYDFSRNGVIPLNEGFFYKQGLIFKFDNMLFHDIGAFYEYNFTDVRPNDIILDIGSTCGGISLQLANRVSHIYCVEPIYVDILLQNIKLNNVENITIIEAGLGAYESKKVLTYGDVLHKTSKSVNILPFKKILELCGGHVDFLKCDCEGGEWDIQPEDLKNIRRIEMELHNLDNRHDFTVFLKMLTNAGFEYISKQQSKITMLVHAKRSG